ncbi:MAG: hypothetical protein WCI61_00525, partial [Chloroflexota bacterium]
MTLANNGGVCALPANTNASLTLAGLTNPVAGTYPAAGFSVATNRDNTAAVAASAITITSGVGGVTFAGPSGALAAASTITVTFHPSFTVGTPTVALASGFANCSATASSAGSVVTITLASSGGVCALLANAVASLTVGGITNPVEATYTASAFTVATSAESSASGAGAAVVITATATRCGSGDHDGLDQHD